MHYFYLVLLSLLVVSCKPSQPSEMEKYQAAKLVDNSTLENAFNLRIAQSIELQKNKPLSSKNVVLSEKGVTELKQSLKSLEQTPNIGNKSSEKDVVLKPTPSTTNEDLKNLDSIEKSNTSDIVNTQNKTNNGALLLNVRDYQDTYTKVHKLATKYAFNIASEEESTTSFHKGNTMNIYAAPENFDQLVKEFRNLAVIIRKKHIWQQEDNNDFVRLKSQIATAKEALTQLNIQLEASTNTEDKLQIQEEITKTTESLDYLALTAQNAISNKPYSAITLTFYQDLEIAKPAPEIFSASFSSNLVIGWENFKVFLLEAALVWPYIAIGLFFFLTILLAVRSSRKRERQFKLQMLHGQNLQQHAATQQQQTSSKK